MDDFPRFFNFVRIRGAEKDGRTLKLMEPVKQMTAAGWKKCG
jgi:hypothetical protein